MSRTRAYTRKMRAKAIKRKKRITSHYPGSDTFPYYAHDGIYSKNTSYTADAKDYASYQLTISSINDIEFENGEDALLTDEQVEFLTTEDMKTVPWIDEEVGDDAY